MTVPIIIAIASIVVICGILFVLDDTLTNHLGIGLLYFGYLVLTKELSHFLEKRRLVCGDLVIVDFRGKYRKAYIKVTCGLTYNKVQLEFADDALNTKAISGNWYPLSRIIIPRYFGKAAKILFAEMEKK